MNKHIILTGITMGLLALCTAAHAVMFPIVVTKKVTEEAQPYTNSIGMTFNLIPAGTFIMGSPDGSGSEPAEPGRESNETQHQVTLTKSFYMQTTEVTNKHWNAMITVLGFGKNPSTSHSAPNYPVETVTWTEAAFFADWLSVQEGLTACYTMTDCNTPTEPGYGLSCDTVEIVENCNGYSLPTEAQWEYAARATTTTAYANPVYFDSSNTEIGSDFNSNLHAMGWYQYNNAMENNFSLTAYESGTKPVAAKQANKWGLFDMHGNIYEWCQDWWDRSDYSPDPATNPQGDETGSGRVFRGGAYITVAWSARSAYRGWNTPAYRTSKLGFRLVLPPGQ